VVTSGCYPGSFNPPTVAHLAIADAARVQAGLTRVDFVLSRVALAKEHVERPTVEDRADVLRQVGASRPWLGVRLTDEQLLADIARGYDALIVGADKWAQVLDEQWYESGDERDRAVARLPRVLVVPRPGSEPRLGPGAEALVLDEDHGHVSSTAVREGRLDLMLPEAKASGVWSVS
jgi:nicotinic acid mononucleotide adenylyltransferase